MVKRQKRLDTTVQLKVRLPEWLRRQLERAAGAHNWSMNSEIVDRLGNSFVKGEGTAELARAVISAHPDVANTIWEILQEDYEDELMAAHVAARLGEDKDK